MEDDKKKKIIIKKKKPVIKVKLKSKSEEGETDEKTTEEVVDKKQSETQKNQVVSKTENQVVKDQQKDKISQVNKEEIQKSFNNNQRNFNQGGNQRFNQGGNQGGNQRFNQGGNQRFNQGGNQGGNQRFNQGGNQRFNQGGNQGGNQRFNQGGNQNFGQKKDFGSNQNQRGNFRNDKDKDNKTGPMILDKGGAGKKNLKQDWKKKRSQLNEIYDKDHEKEFELHNRKDKLASSVPTEIEIAETVLVKEMAHKMNLKVGDLIAKLMEMGYMATINDAIDQETAEIVAHEFGCKVKLKSIYEELQKLEDIEDKEVGEALARPPIVTIMGHVDHGKTSLLDYIRKSRVAAKEAGGITQHIGAYQVELPKGKITFIDTPGHAAFTMMRERGASVTDIVVLVVAADDGVMPQTIEALDHAKAANVPIIIAVNKIDKENANPERVKQQLSEIGLIPEEWGGKNIFVPLSATKGTNVDQLLETILLEAEMKELKANPGKQAKGVILETKMDKNRGAAVTVLIKDGTLKKGDMFIAGIEMGKIRAMFDYTGKEIKEATPSTPVEILGFENLPEAGDAFNVVKSEKAARIINEKRQEIKQIEHAKKITKKVSLDDLYQQMKDGERSDFNIIVKTDVQGTAEALKKLLTGLAAKIAEVNLKLVHCGVGAITESDVSLASSSKSIIAGFNVRPNAKVLQMAKEKGIEIRKYSIIYEVVEDIKAAIEGVLAPDVKEVVLGQAEIREVFKVPKIGNIGGCYVIDGLIKRTAKVRVIREDIVIFTGKISSLKRFKDDAKEVLKGYECGIGVESFNDIKEKDIIEAFEMQETAKKLNIAE